MGSRLEEKVAVITGSTSGIGESIARAFAEQGAKVVISGRRAERGEAVARSIAERGGQVVFQKADLEDPEDCRALIARAEEAFGALDVLVNNAGIFPRHEFDEITVRDWDHLFNTNVRAAFLCSQAAVPFMRKRGGGSIVTIGSCHAFITESNLFAYACSRAALYGMTKKLAQLLAPQIIRSNWITVGWVLTEAELEVQANLGVGHERLEHFRQKQPMKRFTDVEEVVEGCVFLASDAAAHITGSDLNISSGMCVNI